MEGAWGQPEGSTHPVQARSRVYGFLRRVFEREVDEGFLAWCREPAHLDLWSELGLDLGEALEVEGADGILEDLAVDFCGLFVTAGSDGSPHESVHLSLANGDREAGLLFGDPASALKRLYREAGFELEETSHRLPDALCVELEMMERLTYQEARAHRKGDPEELERLRDLQRRMLTEHLGRWLPSYGRRQQAQARTRFYRGMLELAADFVELEAGSDSGDFQGDGTA